MTRQEVKAAMAQLNEIEALATLLQDKCRKAKQHLERFYAPAPKGETKKRLSDEARTKMLGKRRLHIKKAAAAPTAAA